MGDLRDLTSTEAIAKLKELAEGVKTCMFCTKLDEAPFSTRPMGVQEVDEDGDLWFISAASSNKNDDIKQDDKVQLIFSNPGNAHFLSVYGEASIYKDKKTIEDLWTPIAKAWFKEGKDDPDVTVIRVKPLDAYYWDTIDGKLFSLIKIVTAAITGKQMDGGIEGNLEL